MLAVSAGDDLMLRNPQKRIAALLLRLSGQRGCHPLTKPRERIAASQQEISEALNLSLSGTGRLLRLLDKDGVIGLNYGSITIKDRAALFRLLE
jgi:CRP-like cAMP-binding protein